MWTPNDKGISPKISAEWETAQRATFDEADAIAFHLRARSVARRIVTAFAARGIDALLVKGIVLANTIYPSPSARPIRDIDLRIRPRDFSAAVRVLESLGARFTRIARAGANIIAFVSGIDVDLETTLGPPFVARTTTGDLITRASLTDDALGFRHLRIERHDHALLLCINRFKDHTSAAPWTLRDLALIASDPKFDPYLFEARVREAACTTLVHVVARDLATRTADPNWARIAKLIAPQRPGYANARLFALQKSRSDFFDRVMFRASSDQLTRAIAAPIATAFAQLSYARSARRLTGTRTRLGYKDA